MSTRRCRHSGTGQRGDRPPCRTRKGRPRRRASPNARVAPKLEPHLAKIGVGGQEGRGQLRRDESRDRPPAKALGLDRLTCLRLRRVGSTGVEPWLHAGLGPCGDGGTPSSFVHGDREVQGLKMASAALYGCWPGPGLPRRRLATAFVYGVEGRVNRDGEAWRGHAKGDRGAPPPGEPLPCEAFRPGHERHGIVSLGTCWSVQSWRPPPCPGAAPHGQQLGRDQRRFARVSQRRRRPLLSP